MVIFLSTMPQGSNNLKTTQTVHIVEVKKVLPRKRLSVPCGYTHCAPTRLPANDGGLCRPCYILSLDYIQPWGQTSVEHHTGDARVPKTSDGTTFPCRRSWLAVKAR